MNTKQVPSEPNKESQSDSMHMAKCLNYSSNHNEDS